MNLLDTGARESLHDVINKVLRKVSIQMDTRIEELDDTLITWNLLYYVMSICVFLLFFTFFVKIIESIS